MGLLSNMVSPLRRLAIVMNIQNFTVYKAPSLSYLTFFDTHTLVTHALAIHPVVKPRAVQVQYSSGICLHLETQVQSGE